MSMPNAAEILVSGGRLFDSATVTIDGEPRVTETTLTGIIAGSEPRAEYGILAGPGRVSKIALGSRVWREIECDFDLEEQTELRIEFSAKLPPFLDGEDCLALRAILGAEVLPVLDVMGIAVKWSASGGDLIAQFAGSGIVREKGHIVGFAAGARKTVAGTACGILLRVNAQPVSTARAPIPGLAIVRTLGSRVATDGSATFTISDDGGSAECDGSSLRVYGARAFDVAGGRLYGLGGGFVTDGETYAPAPTEAPLEFRAIRQGSLRFFYLFADRWEAWDFAGKLLQRVEGAYERSAFSENYFVYYGGGNYDMRRADFTAVRHVVLNSVFSEIASDAGFLGDIFHGETAARERFYCRLTDMKNFIYPAHPVYAASASNGLSLVYASGKDIKIVLADRAFSTVAAKCGEIERLEFGRDCVYVWGDEGSSAVYADAWLTQGTGSAECLSAESFTVAVATEVNNV